MTTHTNQIDKAEPEQRRLVRTVSFTMPSGHKGTVTGIPLTSDKKLVRLYSAGNLNGFYFVPDGAAITNVEHHNAHVL